jgi:hypothetical protein
MSIQIPTLIPPVPPVRYFYKPLGIEYDAHVQGFVEAMTTLPDPERQEVIKTLTTAERGVLSGYSVRAASLAVRFNSSMLVRTGILASMFENFDDFRYNYIGLAVLRDAALRIGANFDALLVDAASHGTPEGRAYALRFMSNLATIGEMGYECVEEDDGVRYKPLPLPFRGKPARHQRPASG